MLLFFVKAKVHSGARAGWKGGHQCGSILQTEAGLPTTLWYPGVAGRDACHIQLPPGHCPRQKFFPGDQLF